MKHPLIAAAFLALVLAACSQKEPVAAAPVASAPAPAPAPIPAADGAGLKLDNVQPAAPVAIPAAEQK